MNLFKRARSATGRGTGPNDQQQTRTPHQTTDSLARTNPNVPAQASLKFQYTVNNSSSSAIGKKISHPAPEFNQYSFMSQPELESISALNPPPPPRRSLQAPTKPYENYPDLYARNNLDTFVFGAAASASRSSPVDPTSVQDGHDFEESSSIPDTTPRPSVVGHHHHKPRAESCHQQFASAPRFEGLSGGAGLGYEQDAASIHTFGYSSTSSLPGPSSTNKRNLSRVSSQSSSTPHTSSGNDITSSEDEDHDHMHPLSSDVDDPSWQPQPTRHLRASPLYLSDDELDVDDEEGDNDPDLSRRKGSAAIPIGNTTSGASVVSLRRGSRSMDELYSFSFANPSGPSTSKSSGVPPLASSSVPQSEGEIENVRKKSLPPIAPTAIGPSALPTFTVDNAALDLSWMEGWGRTGIVGFNNDDMADIVGQSSIAATRTPSMSGIRRHSTFSTNTVDIMLKNIQAWNSGSQKYQDQRRLWVFEKETYDSLLPPRERPSISYFFSSRSNPTNDANSNLIAPFLDHGGYRVQKEKKAPKEAWKGLPLDTEEYWINGWSGRLRVSRRNTSNNPETLQQRLIFSYVRNQDGYDRTATDKPTVTIHKHSKVVAFSISRAYRQKNPPKSSVDTANRGQPSQPQPEKKKPPILLAPRRVQVSYTSTTTTRKLESHGLLNDDGLKNPQDIERMEKIRKEQEREDRRRQKERERYKGKERDKVTTMEKAVKTFSDKGKEPEGEVKQLWDEQKKKGKLVESVADDNADSVLNVPGPSMQLQESESSGADRSGADSRTNTASSSSTSAMTTPDLGQEGTSSLVSTHQTLVSQGAVNSDRTAVIGQDNFFRRRDSTVGNDDQDDDDDVDSFDSHRRQPHRSTYRETYATLPPEVFEAGHHEHHSRFFGWGKPKVSDRMGPRSYLDASYNPPWLTQPKHSSITRKDIVEDLNMSFQDVGLLPAIGEIKHASSKGKHKKKEHTPKKVKPSPIYNENRIDIFAKIPEDALYMLLPLWPGETDSSSAKRYPFIPPHIPVEKRLYLLVYYKTTAPSSLQDEKAGKKRSKNNPDVQDDKYVMLSSFHISARIVSYNDLQGTCIRIPDHGLAICGSLQEAYETMPSTYQQDDYIIGVCPNRDAGFEFIPEGFEKMGLSHNVPNPRVMESFTDDDDTSSLDTLAVPTPIGHAVMEMSWFGGMALAGFHRDPQWRG